MMLEDAALALTLVLLGCMTLHTAARERDVLLGLMMIFVGVASGIALVKLRF